MKKKVIPAIIIIVLIIFFAGIFVLQQVLKKYSHSDEQADLKSYFNIADDSDVPILLNKEFTEEHARLLDGAYYLDFDSVRKYLNDRFYYGKEDGILVYTTPETIITAPVGESTWQDTDGGSGDEESKTSILDGEILYVSLDYVKKYTNFSYETFTEPNRMVMTTAWEDEQVASVTRDTQVRLRGGVKSEVLREVEKDESVVVLEQLENWTKVVTHDAFIGYIENKRISDAATKSPIPVTDYTEPEYSSLVRDHKINLGFHQIGGPGGNDTLSDVTAQAKSLNVISPTWFAVSSNDGSIRSFGSEAYVKSAHNKGLEVWALLDNFTGGAEVSTHEFLSYAQSRANLIDNVVTQSLSLGVDGINLDFEMVSSEDGQSFVEFVRELSIACRRAGLVFSIDNYVPMNFNDYYDLEEQGVVADYVIIMGYDEHYAGSAEAGSVASLGYVENGIINTLKEVDPSKVINAVPFYTRIWHTKNGTLSSEAVSMKIAANYVSNHSIELQWDAGAGQNYGEFTESDGTFNQIWMEDATSIGQKIDSMKAGEIAGIASWSLGMETADVWDTIAEYVGG
ncbi:MAG: chitinase [Butyrivibrio sp.]|nr:chitinase [Butyrivibrio sp.]